MKTFKDWLESCGSPHGAASKKSKKKPEKEEKEPRK